MAQSMAEVSKEITDDLDKLLQLSASVALDMFGETKERIFPSSGGSVGSDGQRLGKYSESTISLKKGKGNFSTKEVNLQDTEKLLRSYTFTVDRKSGEVKFGFSSAARGKGQTNKKIINKLENQYGEIFAFTKKEFELIDELIEDFTEKLFN
jgi:hypothetical protein